MWQKKYQAGVGVVLMAGGLLTMAGWVAHWPVWALLFPSSTAMVFNTALCFTLCGIVLMPSAFSARPGHVVFVSLASAVIIIAAIQLTENLLALDSGLDWAALHRWFPDANPHPGRMAPNTALTFLIAGYALILGLKRQDRKPVFAVLPAAIITLGLLGIAAYSLLFDLTYESLRFSRMALPVGLGFVLLGFALLADRQTRAHDADNDRERTEERIFGFLGVAMTILLTLAVVSYGSINALIERARWVEHSSQVRAVFEEATSLSDRARVAWRDYAVSGDQSDAVRFRAATDLSIRQFDMAVRLTADNPAQNALLRDARDLADEEFTVLKAAMAPRSGIRANLDRTLSDLKPSWDLQAALANKFRSEEARLQQVRQDQSRKGAAMTAGIIVAGNLIGFSILVFAIWLILRLNAARNRLERALSDSNHDLADLYDNAPCGYHSIDTRGMVVGMNQTELDWLGYTKDEVIGKMHFSRIYSPESQRKASEMLSEFKRQGYLNDIEYDYVRKDGSILPVSINTVAIRDASGQYLMSRTTSNDISLRKQAENELRHANAFLDSLIEHIPLPIVVKNAGDLGYVRVNRAWEELLGYDRSDFVGRSVQELIPPEEAAASIARDQAALARHVPAVFVEKTIRTLNKGDRIVQTMKVPIFSDAGVPLYLLSIGQDITERRKAEQDITALNATLEKNSELLRSANKELESFAYSVSHDLRAPLRAIDGYAQMIEEDCLKQLDDEGRRYVAQIRANSKRMGDLIDDLLRFSRLSRQPLKRVAVDMGRLAGEVLKEQLEAVNGTAPHVDFGPLPAVAGDQTLLRQVWANLLSNAIKYSGKTAVPVIQVSGETADNEVRYAIRDNGAGFDMAYYDKLFGVFQRLHRSDEFEGTGVGLAIVHRVVSRHGGRVWAEGKVNQGASFHFALPMGEVDD